MYDARLRLWVMYMLTHFACCGGHTANMSRYHCDFYVPRLGIHTGLVSSPCVWVVLYDLV